MERGFFVQLFGIVGNSLYLCRRKTETLKLTMNTDENTENLCI